MFVSDPYLLADEDGRRWVICLKQEYRNMLAATQHLAGSLGLDYAGECSRSLCGQTRCGSTLPFRSTHFRFPMLGAAIRAGGRFPGRVGGLPARGADERGGELAGSSRQTPSGRGTLPWTLLCCATAADAVLF